MSSNTGEIRISAPPSFSRYILAPALPSLMGLYPSISIDLNIDSSNVNIEHSEADIAIRLSLPKSNSNDVIVSKLGYMAYFVYGARNSAKGESWITYSKEYSHTPEAMWLSKKLNGLLPVLSCNNPDIMASVAATGVGNALLPEALGNKTPNLKKIGHLVFKREVWILQNKYIARAAHVKIFTTWLKRVCKHTLDKTNK